MESLNTSENGSSLSLASLQDPQIRANPYPLYHRIRSKEPVHWDEPLQTWVLTGYSDIVWVLRDKRFSKAQGIAAASSRLSGTEKESAKPVFDLYSKQMLFADAPYHSRLRGLVSKAFTPRTVTQMGPYIQQLVDELLDAVQEKGRMDAIADFGLLLPCTVIMEMLGLPEEDRRQFKEWSDDFAATLGMVRHDPELFHVAGKSISEATRYICDLRARRLAEPKEDLLSALAAVAEQGERLDNPEMVANTLLLLAAGHETTTKQIGNALLALMRNRDQMEKLKDDPSLIGSAVEELLRYDGSVQIVWRYATEDVEVGGRLIRKGQFLNLVTGAANRDPAQFPDPDRLDLARAENDHLSFGGGIHFCLGAALGRLELQIAIQTVLRRMPNLKLETEDLEWQESPTFRGVVSLPVLF
jgi:cytochrome P450